MTGGTGRYAKARGTLFVGNGSTPLQHLPPPSPGERGRRRADRLGAGRGYGRMPRMATWCCSYSSAERAPVPRSATDGAKNGAAMSTTMVL